ncbi:MAG: TRAP transporter small permease [Clostridiales bacterium]|nr:TRAP transporter small permease [Clostridiales bacterium]
MKALDKTEKAIEHVEEWLVIVMFMAMVVVTMAIVLCRYVFNVQFTAGEEIARYLMIWCGYSGAALGFRTHAHVGVVVFAEHMPKSWQPVILKLRHIISVVVVAALFVIACRCMGQYISLGKVTTATHIPTAVVYAIIPISMALAIVHTISDCADDFKKKEITENQEVES